MRPLLYLMAAMVVMGLAFWAYRENYRTQAQIDRMQAVQREIAGLRENLGVLRAEWAYLNRPDRLRQLVDMNFDRLRLAPVQSNQFGGPRNIDYPPPEPAAPPSELTPGESTAGWVPRTPSNNRGAPMPRPALPGIAPAAAADPADPADIAPQPADPSTPAPEQE